MAKIKLNRYKFNSDLIDNKHHSSIIKSNCVIYNAVDDIKSNKEPIIDHDVKYNTDKLQGTTNNEYLASNELSSEALELLHNIDISKQSAVDNLINISEDIIHEINHEIDKE